MKIIAGLGNPGPKYERTRHNVGFDAVDVLADRLKVNLKEDKKSKAWIAEYRNGTEKIVLMQPTTMMNLSGEAVRPMMDYYNVAAEDVLIMYDDLDLTPGRIRLRQSGGHGGHNGMKSLIKHMNTQKFNRIRIGVGRPANGEAVTSHVLGTFAPKERVLVDEAVQEAAAACEAWLENSFPEVMNLYNKKG
ncbi:aminoacyl-tRNA hydrolase [Salsuginibacillus halophilus]|uniref:aminoacyl-tRNA hydrolase n=1 Tax=Salsuginibacillus halophilus TaxID=517424 RepID=UPI0011B21637|nr:aminoacyl-tRNA hydrolase [Salsuginibacillus halophilus]